MQLEVHQDFAGLTPEQVAGAYADPGLYGSFEDLPFVGTPEPLGHRHEAEVTSLEVRYAVKVDLPAAAHVFVDPARLTFVEHSQLASDGSGTFHVVPDHYGKLLAFAGSYRLAPHGGAGARRSMVGRLRVDLGWKGKLFEGDVTRAIANGLTRSLHAQVPAVEAYLAR